MNWRSSRPRPAPSAVRTANSRCRVSARASSRFARFAHAISSTNPTAACSTQIARLALPMICSCTGCICRMCPKLVLRSSAVFGSGANTWFFWPVRSPHVLNQRASAPPAPPPASRRPSGGRRDRESGCRDAGGCPGLRPIGIQISVRLSITSAPGGMMPITSRRRPLISTIWPMTLCWPPNARLPQLVRQDADRRRRHRAGRVRRWDDVGLALREQPAGERLDAERGQQVIVHRRRSHAQRAIAGGQVDLARRVGADRGERLVQLAELEIFRRRHPELIEAERRELRGQVHQLLGLRIAERAQDHAVDDRENRGICADSERERENRDGGERRRAQQAADSETNILAKVVEDSWGL